MKSELYQESLKLEGELFKLHLKMDRCHRINEYAKLKHELIEKQARREQYLKILEEINKQDAIKRAKRRML